MSEIVLYTNPMSRGRVARWMLEEFPAAQLAPPPAKRAAYYRWLFFGAGPFEAAAVDQALGLDLAPASVSRPPTSIAARTSV
jgi:hypothetical protein